MTELVSAGPRTERDSPFRARLPYTNGLDGQPRPYVVLDAVGPNEGQVRFRGLVDTGADNTSMPHSFIDVFGYGEDDLEPQAGASAGGTRQVHSALRPLRASLPGEPSTAFELMPIFVPELSEVLLGRRDFMNAFAVSFVEESKEFSLFKR